MSGIAVDFVEITNRAMSPEGPLMQISLPFAAPASGRRWFFRCLSIRRHSSRVPPGLPYNWRNTLVSLSSSQPID